MANETVQLAEYASELRYEQLPAAVVQRAKDCIADTAAAVLFGFDLPWSRMIVDYAKRNGAGGRSRILGAGDVPLHAPAVACGRLLRFDADRMTNAIGIAASTAAGLLEFARSGTGAMVKRLHLGRAAESGVLAANLADAGFTGPDTVLEGPFGFLNVYCDEHDL